MSFQGSTLPTHFLDLPWFLWGSQSIHADFKNRNISEAGSGLLASGAPGVYGKAEIFPVYCSTLNPPSTLPHSQAPETGWQSPSVHWQGVEQLFPWKPDGQELLQLWGNKGAG